MPRHANTAASNHDGRPLPRQCGVHLRELHTMHTVIAGAHSLVLVASISGRVLLRSHLDPSKARTTRSCLSSGAAWSSASRVVREVFGGQTCCSHQHPPRGPRNDPATPPKAAEQPRTRPRPKEEREERTPTPSSTFGFTQLLIGNHAIHRSKAAVQINAASPPEVVLEAPMADELKPASSLQLRYRTVGTVDDMYTYMTTL